MRARGNCTRRKFFAIRRQTGISLLELSIVLVITGIILAGLASGVDAQLEQRDRRQTRQQLEEVKQALLGFAVANGRLPCPDSIGNDGTEDPVGGAGGCADPVSVGTLPWVTLGIGQFDAWQRNIAYGVTPTFADNLVSSAPPPGCSSPPGRQPPPPPGVSFELCSVGNFNVLDGAPPGGAMVAQTIATVVISYGRNGGLAPTTADETENQNGDNNAVEKAYSSNPAQPFDDLVEFISANELMYVMLQGGVFR